MEISSRVLLLLFLHCFFLVISVEISASEFKDGFGGRGFGGLSAGLSSDRSSGRSAGLSSGLSSGRSSGSVKCARGRELIVIASNGKNVFLPECMAGGNLYRKEQCNRELGYCWCVDQEEGRVIDGSVIRGSDPSNLNCDGVQEATPEGVRWRSDERCGDSFLINGRPSECNPAGPRPCCSKWGWCGNSSSHCDCEGCRSYTMMEDGQKWRTDGRCGPTKLLNGMPGECDPDSDFPCCSKYGWCGKLKDHCECPECVDYRIVGNLLTEKNEKTTPILQQSPKQAERRGQGRGRGRGSPQVKGGPGRRQVQDEEGRGRGRPMHMQGQGQGRGIGGRGTIQNVDKEEGRVIPQDEEEEGRGRGRGRPQRGFIEPIDAHSVNVNEERLRKMAEMLYNSNKKETKDTHSTNANEEMLRKMAERLYNSN